MLTNKKPPPNGGGFSASWQTRENYCGAIMVFAPQKERVKASSEARLDRSYFKYLSKIFW